jgi:toluene monooxygenase system ferredoxin subunit
MSEWKTTTLHLDEIWEGDLVSCEVDGVDLLLVNLEGRIQAFRNRCPHAGTALSGGVLDGGVLTCSAHLWQFDLTDGGAGINPKGCRLTSHPVRIEDGIVLVQV